MPPRPVLGGLDEPLFLSQPSVLTAARSLHLPKAPPLGPPPCQIRTGWGRAPVGLDGPGQPPLIKKPEEAIRGLRLRGLSVLGAVGPRLPLALSSVAGCLLRARIHIP